MNQSFDESFLKEIRKRFPRIERDFKGNKRIFVDNGAGSLVLGAAADSEYKSRIDFAANTDAIYPESKANEAAISEGRDAVADLLNAPNPWNIFQDESASSIFFKISYALRGTFDKESNVVSTHAEHFANVSPYLEMKRNNSISELRLANIRREDGVVDLNHLASLVNKNTRLIAVTAESNLLGNKVDISEVSKIARENGSLLVVDGVHYVPQGRFDLKRSGCDFFVFSAYKVFGPRGSFLFASDGALDAIRPFNVDREARPGVGSFFETGTRDQGIFAAMTSIVNYISSLSMDYDGFKSNSFPKDRRNGVMKGMKRVESYHKNLSKAVLDGVDGEEGLTSLNNVVLYGIGDTSRLEERGTTFSFNFKNTGDRKAEELYWRKFGITVVGGSHWNLSHDFYSNPSMLRATFLHYNTIKEVKKFLQATKWIANH